jgi:hypothetical protein
VASVGPEAPEFFEILQHNPGKKLQEYLAVSLKLLISFGEIPIVLLQSNKSLSPPLSGRLGGAPLPFRGGWVGLSLDSCSPTIGRLFGGCCLIYISNQTNKKLFIIHFININNFK